MIVAWQFIARNARKTRPVSAAADMIRFAVDGRVIMVKTKRDAANHIRRGGDGSILGQASGNKLPGYDHAVPTGQKPMRRLASQPNLLLL
jgi:hypothetical protein